MPTYENSLALNTQLTQVGTNNVIFTRPVATQLDYTQGTGNILPKVTTLLVPVQELKVVLPKVTSTLEPVQTVATNIKVRTVSNTLIPGQIVETNIKNGVLTTLLTPTELINTTSSLLSNASRQTLDVMMGFVISDGGSFGYEVISTLIHTHQAAGYCIPFVTIGASRYRADSVYVDSLAILPTVTITAAATLGISITPTVLYNPSYSQAATLGMSIADTLTQGRRELTQLTTLGISTKQYVFTPRS